MFSVISQLIWQVFPTFWVKVFLNLVVSMADIILGVLAPLAVAFILNLVTFLAVFFLGALALFAVAVFFLEALALLAVAGFLASVALASLVISVGATAKSDMVADLLV